MTPRRTALTEARVPRLPLPSKGQVIVYDSSTPGFGVRLAPGGTRAFIARKKINGRAQTFTLGRYPALPVEQARKLAIELFGKIAGGQNPAEVRRAARAELTLGQFFNEYMNRHALQHKRTADSDATRYRLYLTPWEQRRLSSITQRDVQALHSSVGRQKGLYAANRLLAFVSVLFNLARDWGHYRGDNPTRGVKKFRERSRDRFLQPEELPRFFAALAEEPSTTIKDYILVSLLTGARRANVLTMRWEELDLNAGLWRIPASKSKNAETMSIPIHKLAVEVLRTRQALAKSEWVFPGTGVTGHLQEPWKGWKRILSKAGLDDLRLHDLRRTLGSWQAAAGSSLSVIGRSLGHKNVATTAIYARLNLDPVRHSVDAAVDAMLAAANPGTPTKVIRGGGRTNSSEDNGRERGAANH